MHTDTARRLSWHGAFLVLAGLLIGLVIGATANPRMALSAHTGTLMTGIWFLALGAVWPMVQLTPPRERIAWWTLLFGAYGSAAGLLLAAALGTRQSTPIHGAAAAAAPWAEAVVAVTLTLPAISILIGSGLVLVGLGRQRG